VAVSWNYILCDVIRCYYPLVPNGSPSQAARGCWTTSCGLDMVTCMPCCESTWARSEGFMACIGQPSFGMGWALAVYVPTCQSVRECTCTTYMKVGHGLCHCLLFISISLSIYNVYVCVYIRQVVARCQSTRQETYLRIVRNNVLVDVAGQLLHLTLRVS
jgi:hypothetical protein